MKFAIVYDSRTGTTKKAAEEMGRIVRASGHDCTVESVKEAQPEKVSAADVVCLGSWTQGLFVIGQHATKATMKFIEQLGPLNGKPVCVFCTYKLSEGRLLEKMAQGITDRGGVVAAHFKSRGPSAGRGFMSWVGSTAASAR